MKKWLSDTRFGGILWCFVFAGLFIGLSLLLLEALEGAASLMIDIPSTQESSMKGWSRKRSAEHMLTRRTGRMVLLLFTLCLAIGTGAFSSAEAGDGAETAIPVKVLLLPKFEVDQISGDLPGEAQYYYEGYLDGAAAYEVPYGYPRSRLYVKDGVAMYVTGMGKVNAALSTMAVLTDSRFDFSEAYVISTGCAGSARDTTVMGDVFVISAAVDYDLGHHADSREMEDPERATWFHDAAYDDAAFIMLDPELTDRVYELVRDVKVDTTELTRSIMLRTFEGAEWAGRDPMVLRGTGISGDNYWKGAYDHENALKIVGTYGCPDPYAVTEMEDVAVANALKRLGMLDRLIILRDSVNMDVFVAGATPELLWDPAASRSESDGDQERADIFSVAMENNFKVGRVIIEAILNGTL